MSIVAVAAPTILPVPMVALNAVHNAPKLDISPSPASSLHSDTSVSGKIYF